MSDHLEDGKLSLRSKDLLARILRENEGLSISEDAKDKIKSLTIEYFTSTNFASKIPSPESMELISGSKSPELAAKKIVVSKRPEIIDEKLSEQSAHTDFQIQLKYLIDKDAAWSEISVVAKKILQSDNSESTKAKLVEVCYLNGDKNDVFKLLNEIFEGQADWYLLVHEKIREGIARTFWEFHSEPTPITMILLSVRNSNALLPIEAHFIYLAMRQNIDLSSAYLFFLNHKSEIFHSVSALRNITLQSLEAFVIYVASHAISIGIYDDARRFLNQIPNDSEHFPEALSLLAKIRHTRIRQKGEIETSLADKSSWQLRLSQLDGTIERAKLTPNLSSGYIEELNFLIEDITNWLPGLPSAWRSMSRVLIKHFNFREKLPALLEVFKNHAREYQEGRVEAAFWEPVIEEAKIVEFEDLKYLHVLARIHLFVVQGKDAEVLLWEAKNIDSSLQASPLYDKYFSWQELVRSASDHITSLNNFSVTDRKMMLHQLAVVGEFNVMSSEEIDEYLHETNCLSSQSIDYLIRLAKSRGFDDSEFKLFRIKSSRFSLTNNDLDRMFSLSVRLMKPDLSWRCLTLLKSRQVLALELNSPWNMTSENRIDFFPLVLDPKDIDLMLEESSDLEKIIAKFCIFAGPQITKLLVDLDSRCKSASNTSAKRLSGSENIIRSLQRQTWFKYPDKIFYFSRHRSASHHPLFVLLSQTKAIETWKYTLYLLIEASGAYYWNFDIFYLHSLINEHLSIFSGGRISAIQSTPKISNWWKNLNPVERQALLDMHGILQKINSEKFVEIVEKFYIRLATALTQNHFEALSSLREMKASMSQIWDLEAFLLSECYSKLRFLKSTHINKPIPKSIVNGFNSVLLR
ncbi:MAG: hypothetical protein KBD78_11735 [Oligoflexales bacterium]|nr:hypothetical protein [Oligoflexales bacterium]